MRVPRGMRMARSVDEKRHGPGRIFAILQWESAVGNAAGPRHLRPPRPWFRARASKSYEDRDLARAAASKPINWTNALTLLSVAILVGTELIGAGAAAGWAIGGLFNLGPVITHALEGLLVLAALTGLYFFLRAALGHEPIRG